MNNLDPRYPEETTPYAYTDLTLPCVEALLTLPKFFKKFNKSQKEDIIGDLGSLTQVFQGVKQRLGACFPNKNVALYSHPVFAASLDTTKNYQNCKSVELVLTYLNNYPEEYFIEFLLCSSIDRAATIFDLTTRIIALRIKEMHTQQIAEEILSLEEVKAEKKNKKKKTKKKNKKSNKNEFFNESCKIVDFLLNKVMENMYVFIEEKETQEKKEENQHKSFENTLKTTEKSLNNFENSELLDNDSEFQLVNQKKKHKRSQPQQKVKYFVAENKQISPKPKIFKESDTKESKTKEVKPSKFL